MENRARAKKYRGEGYDHGQIRRYLANEGFEDFKITAALKQMDNNEIYELYLKHHNHRISNVRVYCGDHWNVIYSLSIP